MFNYVCDKKFFPLYLRFYSLPNQLVLILMITNRLTVTQGLFSSPTLTTPSPLVTGNKIGTKVLTTSPLTVSTSTKKPVNTLSHHSGDSDSRHLPRGWFGAIPDDDGGQLKSKNDNIGDESVQIDPEDKLHGNNLEANVQSNSDVTKDSPVLSVPLNYPDQEPRIVSSPGDSGDSFNDIYHGSSTSTFPSILSVVSSSTTPISSAPSSRITTTPPSLSTFTPSSPTSTVNLLPLNNQNIQVTNNSDNSESTIKESIEDEINQIIDEVKKMEAQDEVAGVSVGVDEGGKGLQPSERGGNGNNNNNNNNHDNQKHYCECKNETTHSWDRIEVTCSCIGETIIRIPGNMTKGVAKLSMLSTGIRVITANAFQMYSTSLQDLYFESNKKLERIEPEAFKNLHLLRTVYIKQAPLLRFIPEGVFYGNFPKFRVLKIIHSGLEVLPSMTHFVTKGIISILDFDSNRLKNITIASIKVKASSMILDYNQIERVHSLAFAGSHIAKLSLKGNRKLVEIDDEAFVGLKNLGKLDLSETSITRLPTKGLEEVEVIKIVDTFTLKVFPSVFNFKNLKEAQLTYPYHCCAFKFPATHDPKEFASRAYEGRRYCRQGASNNKISPGNIKLSPLVTTLSPPSLDFDSHYHPNPNPNHLSQYLHQKVNSYETISDNQFEHQKHKVNHRDNKNPYPYNHDHYQSNQYPTFHHVPQSDQNAPYWQYIGDRITHFTRRLNSFLSDYSFIESMNSLDPIDSSSHLNSLTTPHHSKISSSPLSSSSFDSPSVALGDDNEHPEYYTNDNNNDNPIRVNSDQTNWFNISPFSYQSNGFLSSPSSTTTRPTSSLHFSTPSSFGEFITSQTNSFDSNIFGKIIANPSDSVKNSSSLDILEDALNPNPGFGQVQPPILELSPSLVPHSIDKSKHGDDEDILGQFHPTTASVIPPIHALCGEYAQIFRDIKCSPEPDAFNPCEDVMGNLPLRIADWIISVAAVLGNLAVMIVLMSGRFTMSVSKFLMCNLAFADFCMGVYLLIIAVIDLHTIGVYFNYAIDWQHGLGCKITGFITVFASELSIITLTVITLERWYAITYAIHLNRRLKLGLAVKVMIGGWIYAIIMASLPLFGVSGYSKTSICLPMENKDIVDIVYLTLLLTINALAFVLISACYGKMYLAIVSQRSRIATSDKTVAKRMALLVFTDFACWAPIAFFGLTAVAGYPLINLTNSKILLVFFYPLNSCANPFLYAILTKQYRRDFFILASRYGFCTKKAARYKGTSANCKHHRKPSIKSRKGIPKCGQVIYDPRNDRYSRYRSRNCVHQNCSSEENSGRSVIYSAIDFYPDSSVSGDSSHEILKMGHFICDHHHTCSHNKKKHKKCQNHYPQIYSDDESNSSISANKKSPLVIRNGKELRRLPSCERDEILKKVITEGQTNPSRTVCSGIWTTSTSCSSIHKSHKNCTSWIQRDSSSGEKSSGGGGGGGNSNNTNGTNNGADAIQTTTAIDSDTKSTCCKHCKQITIENGSYIISSHSNSAADDTEI